MNNLIKDSKAYKSFLEDFDQNIDFLNSFSELLFYNRRIISFFSESHKMHVVNTTLIDSSIQTLHSIKLCCSIGSFSDANTLIRKFRDDLLLYTYILDVIRKRKIFLDEDITKIKIENSNDFYESFSKLRFNTEYDDDEKAVSSWLNNSVLKQPRNIKMKLSFENYMKYLKGNENVKKVIQDYNLEEYWEKLRNRLNNYVHSNGSQFTLHNLINAKNPNLKIHFKNVNIRISYMVTFFLVLIIMTESSLISSTDLIDYLDCNESPPEDCQYEIAPFIQKYIDEKVVKIHSELKQFLIDNNNYGMKIN